MTLQRIISVSPKGLQWSNCHASQQLADAKIWRNLTCLKRNSLPSLHIICFSVQSTNLPSLSHYKPGSRLPLLFPSPISHKILSLVSQECLGTLLLLPLLVPSPDFHHLSKLCFPALSLSTLWWWFFKKCRSNYLFLTLKVWLAPWLSVLPGTERSPVPFPVRVHAQVWGLISGRGACRVGAQIDVFLSLIPSSLSLSYSIKKHILKNCLKKSLAGYPLPIEDKIETPIHSP